MLNIGIIVGTTRPGRKADTVARWVLELAQKRSDAKFEIIDIQDFNLPLLDEPIPPSMGKYTHEHTKRWAAKIDAFDAFIFVTPEYNHSIPGSLKNAIDFIYAEWNNKAAGIVSYGSMGGARAAEQLRGILAELKIASVRAQVMLSLFADFENFTKFKPTSFQEESVKTMLDQIVEWGEALKHTRK